VIEERLREVACAAMDRLVVRELLGCRVVVGEYVVGIEVAGLHGREPAAELAEFFASESETDMQVVWPVLGDRLRYPLDEDSPADDPDETYYDIELWLSRDYVYKMSEQIQPFDDDRCGCGAELVYEPEIDGKSLFYTSRMHARCNQCQKPFDASTRIATVKNAWTNAPSEVAGGATFRFALVVDCGKCWPEAEGGFHIHPDLRALCETHFGQPFYEIANVY
jgi:hypothetical protein